MDFVIDERILSSCVVLHEWELSHVLLKNNLHYPWFILVPKRHHVEEIEALSLQDSILLMEEIRTLSRIIRHYFKPDKINVASLGNIVSQLHVHVIARFKHDDLWPQSVFQAALETTSYPDDILDMLVRDLKRLF